LSTTLAETIIMDRAPSAGFTLIELLISIAIVAILSALAIPSYTDHVRRGHSAEAATALATLRVSLEQYYQDNRRYGANTGCGVTLPSAREFSYRCETAADGQSFLAIATGDSTRGMGDFIYTINHAGTRRTTGLPGSWGTVPRDCWVGSKGGAC
jgi:type IV pilus assembly protein PilE